MSSPSLSLVRLEFPSLPASTAPCGMVALLTSGRSRRMSRPTVSPAYVLPQAQQGPAAGQFPDGRHGVGAGGSRTAVTACCHVRPTFGSRSASGGTAGGGGRGRGGGRRAVNDEGWLPKSPSTALPALLPPPRPLAPPPAVRPLPLRLPNAWSGRGSTPSRPCAIPPAPTPWRPSGN